MLLIGKGIIYIYIYMCVCVCVRVRACVRVCVSRCARACVLPLPFCFMVGHIYIASGFKPGPGYVWMVFHLSLRLITLGGHAPGPSSSPVYKSDHKTRTLTLDLCLLDLAFMYLNLGCNNKHL